jgi:hypothetical protein
MRTRLLVQKVCSILHRKALPVCRIANKAAAQFLDGYHHCAGFAQNRVDLLQSLAMSSTRRGGCKVLAAGNPPGQRCRIDTSRKRTVARD